MPPRPTTGAARGLTSPSLISSSRRACRETSLDRASRLRSMLARDERICLPHERVRRDRLLELVDGEGAAGGGGGALGAADSRADRAGGADRSDQRFGEVD